MFSGAQLEIAVKATGFAETQPFLNSPSLLGNRRPWVSRLVFLCGVRRSEKRIQNAERRFVLWMPPSTSRFQCLFCPCAALGNANVKLVSRA